MATKVEVAKHLDISDRQVRNLTRSGVLPATKGFGGCDLDECRLAYIRYLRGRASGQVSDVEAEGAPLLVPPGSPSDASGEEQQSLEREREKEEFLLVKERRIGQQQKNEISSRKVVPVEFAVFSLSKMSAEIATVLDTLPMVMRRKHPDLDTRHLDTLSRELAKARNVAAGLHERLPDVLEDYFDTIGS